MVYVAEGRFKNGQLPVLQINDYQLAQSNAILIYAAKQTGLYPWDPLTALQARCTHMLLGWWWY